MDFWLQPMSRHWMEGNNENVNFTFTARTAYGIIHSLIDSFSGEKGNQIHEVHKTLLAGKNKGRETQKR
jgi:hypothetical protein